MTGLNERLTEDISMGCRWRDGWIEFEVLELFQEHLDDPAAITEMIEAVRGGNYVMEAPPYLASLV